jgi:hypothetical protein
MNPKITIYSILALFLLILGRSVGDTNSSYANLDTDKLEKDKLSNKIISQQMQNDMFYGTDDYFGQNRDLSYCDSVVPTFRKPVVVEKPKEEQKEENNTQNTQKDTTVTPIVASNSSSPSLSSSPAETTVSPVVTPTTPSTPSEPVVIPPPPETPPPEVPPACPT